MKEQELLKNQLVNKIHVSKIHNKTKWFKWFVTDTNIVLNGAMKCSSKKKSHSKQTHLNITYSRSQDRKI